MLTTNEDPQPRMLMSQPGRIPFRGRYESRGQYRPSGLSDVRSVERVLQSSIEPHPVTRDSSVWGYIKKLIHVRSTEFTLLSN